MVVHTTQWVQKDYSIFCTKILYFSFGNGRELSKPRCAEKKVLVCQDCCAIFAISLQLDICCICKFGKFLKNSSAFCGERFLVGIHQLQGGQYIHLGDGEDV